MKVLKIAPKRHNSEGIRLDKDFWQNEKRHPKWLTASGLFDKQAYPEPNTNIVGIFQGSQGLTLAYCGDYLVLSPCGGIALLTASEFEARYKVIL